MRENFDEVVSKLVNFYTRRSSMDRDELSSIANEAFAMALSSYCPEKASLTTWVSVTFRSIFLEQLRQRRRWVRTVPTDNLDHFPIKSQFDPGKFFAELSDDAQTIGELVFSSPREIRELVSEWQAPLTSMSQLGRFLRKLGWTARRITESFQEIREALS